MATHVRGIDICLQATFTQPHRIITKQLELTDDEMVVYGMPMGYMNRAVIENALVAKRAPVSEFTHFLD